MKTSEPASAVTAARPGVQGGGWGRSQPGALLSPLPPVNDPSKGTLTLIKGPDAQGVCCAALPRWEWSRAREGQRGPASLPRRPTQGQITPPWPQVRKLSFMGS